MKKLLLILLAAPLFVSAAAAQVRFVPLGYLPNSVSVSEAHVVTPDGSQIVGYSSSQFGRNLPALWLSNDHWQSGTINYVGGTNTAYHHEVFGVSADGGVIVGDRNLGGAHEAVYWTANQFQTVPFQVAPTSATTYDVSGDGRFLVGLWVAQVQTPTGIAFNKQAFRWDRTLPAATILPTYPGSDSPMAQANAVSDDGLRVAGWVMTSSTTKAAARWENGGAPVLLSSNGDAVIAVEATGMTPDGSIIVGAGYVAATGQGVAFKWTAQGTVALPMPTNDGGQYGIVAATAYAVSGDGRVTVGYGQNDHGGTEALYWDQTGRFRVAATANLAGQLPPSWEAQLAYATDYFGNTICGYGRNSSGAYEAYTLVRDITPAAPTLSAPRLRPFFDSTGQKVTIRYQTVPGLKYRVLGGSSIGTLAALTAYSAGLGDEREYSVAGAGSKYFLRVETAPN